jgi:hypothetical protein
MDGFKVVQENILDEETVDSLLVSALEGGSRDWATIEAHVDRKGDKAKGCKYLSDYVLKGSGIVISNETAEGTDGPDYRKTVVNRVTVEQALQRMAKQDPRAFQDIINDNADAITGDILLQICVLEKVVYG